MTGLSPRLPPGVDGLRGALIAAALAVVAGLAGVFTVPPLDRDEARYAQASAQMLESGDFVRIRFMDEARNKKPAGIHWLQAASVAALTGPQARQIWAYRLPSVLGAALAAFACFLAGRALVTGPAAFAGASLFAVGLLMGGEAGIAKTDAALAAATTLMMAALAHLKFGGGGRRTALAFWAALAAGVLIKGPIAPVLAGLALAALFAWERRAAWTRPLLSWPGPALFLLLTLPWFVAVELTDQGFLREAVGVDFAPKLVSATEGHAGAPGYHTLALLLQTWPATLFLVPGAVLAWRALRAAKQGPAAEDQAARVRFLLCWAIPFLIVLELTPTKLSHYGLPAYPAVALIAGAGFSALTGGARMIRAEIGGAVLFLQGGAIAIAAAIVLAALFGDGVAMAAAIATGAVCAPLAIAACLYRRHALGLGLAIAAALAWHAGARGLVVPHLAPLTLSGRIAALVPPEHRPLAATDYREPSLAFLMRGEVRFLYPEEFEDAALKGEFRAYAAPRNMEAVMRAAIADSAGCADVLGEVAGLNYSNGDAVDLIVLAPGTGCAGGR